MAAFSTIAALATGAAGLASGAMSANAQKSAAKKQNNAAKKAAALQQQQYQTTLNMQMPSYRLGNAAQGIYASALGLPGFSLMQYGYPGYQDPQAGTQQGAPTNAQRMNGGIVNAAGLGGQQQEVTGGQPNQPGLNSYQGPEGQTLQQSNDATLTSILGGTDIPSLVMAQPGYQTQMQQGIDAARGTAASTGSLRSGATLKGLADYGQHTFGSYWDKWLGNVGNLAGLGGQAANAVSQAGQANASNQGNLMMQGASAQAQGITGAANAWAEGLGGAAGSLGAYPWSGNGAITGSPLPGGNYGFQPNAGYNWPGG